MTNYHLAQANILKMIAPLDSEEMKPFVEALAPVNATAEAAPGFVWRLTGESEDSATDIRVFDDDMIILNLSVWTDIDALWHYVYSGDHLEIFRRKEEFQLKIDRPKVVMWWLPTDQLPTPEDSVHRLDYLHQHGPTPYAFTFKQRFTVEALLAMEAD